MSTTVPNGFDEDSLSTPARLQSLDAYRGLIMISLAFEGFGLAATAARQLERQPDSPFWQAIRFQFTHVEWTGWGYWDLIQPSFMFMVGVALPFSYGKREILGASYGAMFGRALWRSLVLIGLGIFLISNGASATNWSFMNVLTQIGLGYPFLFLLWKRPFWVQGLAVLLILAATWGLYRYYPAAGLDVSQGDPEVGVTAEWAQEHLAGVPRAWHKNANVGHAIDVKVLNWLPREEPFKFNAGGYQTLNFLPSLATMVLGLMAGELLRLDYRRSIKLLVLVVAGVACVAAGWGLEVSGVSPLVKRIWTPSWAVFSAGICLLILSTLYALIDVLEWRSWSFPLVVVGVNSLAMYCMGMLLKPWTARTFQTHFGSDLFLLLGAPYEPLVRSLLVGFAFWLVCLWLYRNRFHIRV